MLVLLGTHRACARLGCRVGTERRPARYTCDPVCNGGASGTSLFQAHSTPRPAGWSLPQGHPHVREPSLSASRRPSPPPRLGRKFHAPLGSQGGRSSPQKGPAPAGGPTPAPGTPCGELVENVSRRRSGQLKIGPTTTGQNDLDYCRPEIF